MLRKVLLIFCLGLTSQSVTARDLGYLRCKSSEGILSQDQQISITGLLTQQTAHLEVRQLSAAGVHAKLQNIQKILGTCNFNDSIVTMLKDKILVTTQDENRRILTRKCSHAHVALTLPRHIHNRNNFKAQLIVDFQIEEPHQMQCHFDDEYSDFLDQFE